MAENKLNLSLLEPCLPDNVMIMTDATTDYVLILGILHFMLAVCGSLINLFTILVMYQAHCYKTLDEILRLILLIIDTLNCFLGLPLFGAFYTNLSYQQKQLTTTTTTTVKGKNSPFSTEGYIANMCILAKFANSISISLTVASILTVFAMTSQLYLAIVRPFVYNGETNQRFSLPTLVASFAVMTSLSFVTFFQPLEFWPVTRYCLVSTVSILYAAMIIFFWKVRRELQRMEKNSYGDKDHISMLNAYKKANCLAFTVMFAFTVCYIPAGILIVPRHWIGMTKLHATYIFPLLSLISMLNVICDPLIYCFRLAVVRTKIRTVFRRTRPPVANTVSAVNSITTMT